MALILFLKGPMMWDKDITNQLKALFINTTAKY